MSTSTPSDARPRPRLAERLLRRRRSVLALTVVLFALAGAFGADVISWLQPGGFDDPGAESTRAAALLDAEFDAGDPDLVLLVTAGAGGVDTPEATADGLALAEEVRGLDGVAQVVSYWELGGPPPFRSADGDQAMVLVRLEGDEDVRIERAGELNEELTGTSGSLDVAVGGPTATFARINEVIEEDLVRAEVIAFPVTLLLLVLVFGSVVAASLPLLIGGIAIVGTFAVLEVVARTTDVSIFALNFTTAMGLGLAIDYSLLVVSRFREELAEGHATHAAVVRTVRTAGRTVLFSAGTVAASLVALLAFEQYFLRSFAYAGIAVVGLAALGATVVLPALLAALGTNVNRLTIRRRREVPLGEGRWGRIAVAVMRRPVPVATASIAVLLLLGAPFLGIRLGFPDDRVLPPDVDVRAVGDELREGFASFESQPTTVVAPGVDPTDPAVAEDLDAYAAAVSRVEGVSRVDGAGGSWVAGTRVLPAGPTSARFLSDAGTWLSVVPSVEPVSLEAEAMVADVRAVPAPAEVLVGGSSAALVDGKAGMLDRLPLALAIVAVVTFVVLFLTFGSVVLPLKAIVLNLLSLSATFGALVWVFQDGNLAGLLGFTATGTITIAMPVLMFIVAFGLSMDYEVFLLSRIAEEHRRTGDDLLAVANGLERTGRIVTAAAVLIAVVFAAFATGRVSFMKMFGVGLTLAVLVDAFVVRATLVPAFMRLAGRANWWAPAPLRRLHERIGLREHVDLDEPDASAPVPPPAPVGAA